MPTGNRSTILGFVLAGICLVLAVVTGMDLLGQPLRLVNLVKIIGMSATAGVLFSQAMWSLRQQKLQKPTS